MATKDLTKSRMQGLDIDPPKGENATPPTPLSPNSEVFGGELTWSHGQAHVDTDGVKRTALGHVATEGHSHVAAVWGNAQPKLTEIRQQVITDAEGKFDVTLKIDDLKVTAHDANTLALVKSVSDDKPTILQELAVGRVTKHTDVPNAMVEYLNENGFADQTAFHLNRGLDFTKQNLNNDKPGKGNDKTFLGRFKTGIDGAPILRTILSDRYGIINNSTAFDLLFDALPETGRDNVLASHFSYDGDNFTGNLLIPDTMKTQPDSDYGVGIYVSNSEIGEDSFKIAPFLFRAICVNGMVWNRQVSTISLNKRHLGTIDLDDLRKQTIDAVVAAISEGHLLLNQMNLSREAKVENVNEVIAYLCRANKLSVKQGNKWNELWQTKEEYKADNTVWGVVNALTEASQSFGDLDRFYMEETAGRILTPSLTANIDNITKSWNTISIAATRLTEKEVRQYVYVAA